MVGDIQYMATLMNVAIVKCVQKGRVKVWMGKPNGLLQILWERGFIDPNAGKSGYYTLGGRNDQYGNTILDTSLRNLMRNCTNFIEEYTLLHTQARKIGDHLNHIIVN